MCLPRWSYQGSLSFADCVLQWGGQNFSDFPWRNSRSPYEILVAELILKRTTAAAAARAYEDFLVRFPSLQVVASASDEELVKTLSIVGLQHQRARSMKQLAGWLLSKLDGDIPRDLEGLLEVPGLGEYSATAILSFAYGVPAAVLDTNVERILLRVYGNTLPSRPSRTMLRQVAQNLLPKEGHREYNYGLLDLGRLICKYGNPKCGECPLTSVCDFYGRTIPDRIHKEGKAEQLPFQSKLREIRHNRGISLTRLAETANVSRLTVIRIEAGRSSARRKTLDKLALALCVSTEELAG